jgi:hypothetical protein
LLGCRPFGGTLGFERRFAGNALGLGRCFMSDTLGLFPGRSLGRLAGFSCFFGGLALGDAIFSGGGDSLPRRLAFG